MKDDDLGFISRMVDETVTNYRLNLLSTVNAPKFICQLSEQKSFILKTNNKQLEIPINFVDLKKLNSSESYQLENNLNTKEFFNLIIDYFEFDETLSKLIFVKNFEIENEFIIYQEFEGELSKAA